MHVYMVLTVSKYEGIDSIEGIFSEKDKAIAKARALVEEENTRWLSDNDYDAFPDPEFARQRDIEFSVSQKYREVNVNWYNRVAVWANGSCIPGEEENWEQHYHQTIEVREIELE